MNTRTWWADVNPGARGQAGRTPANVAAVQPASREVASGRDVILAHRGRNHRRSLLVAGAATAKGLDRFGRLPALEHVDAPRGEQVSAEREVKATGRAAGPGDDF